MSGGFAYQYDPNGDFKNSISHDSVLLGSLSEDSDESKIHSDAIKVLLSWHIEATNSKLAINLLENWETEKSNFSYITPKALLQYQDSDAILEAKSRKELLEELAAALASHQVNKLKKAWRSGDAVIKGQVPINMSSDTDNMYELLNTYAVLDAAQKLALKKFDSNLSIDHPDVVKTTRNLILTEDYALMNLLLRHSRQAIANYNDVELAAMIANKRLNDFTTALTLRNVLSMDSPATYGWIIHQQHKNHLHRDVCQILRKCLHLIQ